MRKSVGNHFRKPSQKIAVIKSCFIFWSKLKSLFYGAFVYLIRYTKYSMNNLTCVNLICETRFVFSWNDSGIYFRLLVLVLVYLAHHQHFNSCKDGQVLNAFFFGMIGLLALKVVVNICLIYHSSKVSLYLAFCYTNYYIR